MSLRPSGSSKTCREKALDLLARRSHFRRELEIKLRKRAYGPSEIERTLDELEDEGLLDDARTAGELVESRLGRSPEGPMRLIAELEKRGADGDLARRAVEEALPADDLELAKESATRWLTKARAGKEARLLAAGLARHLARKGFTAGSVAQVLDESRDEIDEIAGPV